MNRLTFLVAAGLAIGTPIALGNNYYLLVRGQKQGPFKGDGSVADRITCVGFEYSLKSPRDAATGQTASRRQHGVIRIVKEWGASSSMFQNALVTNEQLSNIEFSFLKVDQKTGQEVVYQRVTLASAVVSEIRQYVGPYADAATTAKHLNAKFMPGMEEITLIVEQPLVITRPLDKTMGSDSWAGAEAKPLTARPPARIPPPGAKPRG